MKELMFNWIAELYADAYTNMKIGETVKEAMGGGESSASVACQSVIDMCINQICPAISGIGLAIAIVFFLIALLELSTSERLTLEFFIKFFSKLVISVVLISSCSQLVNACVDFGNALTISLTGPATGGPGYTWEEIKNNYYDSFKEADLAWIFMVIDSLSGILIINIVSKVLTVVIYIVSFTRMLEMGVRGALMPIALGMMSDDGWRGAGGRYIRKFLAVCSQGAVLVLIGELSNTVMLTCSNAMMDFSDGVPATGSFLVLLGVAFASVSLMFKSMGIINDVFGA